MPSTRQRACALVLAAATLTPWHPVAAEQPARCPQELPPPPRAATAPAADLPTQVLADEARSLKGNVTEFFGHVEFRRGADRLLADRAAYDKAGDLVTASGDIDFKTANGERFLTSELSWRPQTRTGFLGTGTFALRRPYARGGAERVDFLDRDHTRLTQASFTTCAPGQDDWFLKMSELELDHAEEVGTARHVWIDFLGAPVAYLPYFSFPITARRKSGFLFPSIGYSDKLGYELSVPYYFNLAPNYDATVTPRILTDRGLQLQNQFRYLTRQSEGRVELDVLPNDRQTGEDRTYGVYLHKHLFNPLWSGTVDLKGVSDKEYLVEFGDRLGITSQAFLPQNVEAAYRGPLWTFSGRATGYQTVDPLIPAAARPYERLPQLALASNPPGPPNAPQLHFESEWVRFRHDTNLSGDRLNLSPGVSLPLATSYAFLTPKLSVRYIDYRLDREQDGAPALTRNLFSLDSGLFFERDTDWGDRPFVQTLEPRLFYLKVPYRNQDALPNFDTGVPGFSFANLFRENRLIGGDRVADADQATVAVTTRFLDGDNGMERLRASLGRTYYFDDLRVNVPPGLQTPTASDLAGEVTAWFAGNWHVRSAVQWDEKLHETRASSSYLQYQPARDRILNVGYNFVRNATGQREVSLEWPLADRWRLRARSLYSTREDRNLESYVGVEYNACCWAARFTMHTRLVSNPTQTPAFEQVRAFLFELQFTGLSSVGRTPESPLRQSLFSFPQERPAAPQD
ncbi:MAG: hypothetical protein A2151_01430 [Candidatus Muproteobacteria bacterium RBG_16_65_34]|uniref:LPS-assembly protein LptD n=1 Tax=Candidatus Muproteobacteria bacterium RBG_16_65_34 TaxID=1817760 RepID=A0A1F6TS47_9PROT|nr:MAG: hypothetical protein A2151_01430 [Candidatus Muproteobacteria bacterium RBG_16_65_34]